MSPRCRLRARTASRLRARTENRLRARTARRFVAVAALACAGVVVSASPAAAHGIGGTEPTNYETTLTRVEPAVRGVHVEVIDLGDRLRLTNDTDRDVVVLGYDGEPYLRVGPRGVFENRRSPATYLNRSRDPRHAPPRSADADAPASGGGCQAGTSRRGTTTARTSWARRPHPVRNDPDHRHVLDRWTVELRDGNRAVRVRGLLTWVPPPSPWPWVGLAVVTAALVVGLSRTRWWRAVLVVALAVLVVCALLHALGHWEASSAGIGTKAGESIYSIAGDRTGPRRARLGVAPGRGRRRAVRAVAAIFLLVAGGLADIATLGPLPGAVVARSDRRSCRGVAHDRAGHGVGAGGGAAPPRRSRRARPSGGTRRDRPCGRTTVTS